MLVWGRWVSRLKNSCMHLTLVSRSKSSGLLKIEDRTDISIVWEKLSRKSKLTIPRPLNTGAKYLTSQSQPYAYARLGHVCIGISWWRMAMRAGTCSQNGGMYCLSEVIQEKQTHGNVTP